MATQPYSISVIIPVFNNGQYISQALDSVLQQSRPAAEIIVVDDCSTDNSRAVAEQYAKTYGQLIKVLSTGVNSGSSVARNIGIQAAHGDLIALLDGDDYWKDCHLETVAGLLERFPEAGWAFSELLNLYPDGRLEPFKCLGSIPDNKPFDGFPQFAWFCRAQTSTVIIKRSVFKTVGYFARSTESHKTTICLCGSPESIWLSTAPL